MTKGIFGMKAGVSGRAPRFFLTAEAEGEKQGAREQPWDKVGGDAKIRVS